MASVLWRVVHSTRRLAPYIPEVPSYRLMFFFVSMLEALAPDDENGNDLRYCLAHWRERCAVRLQARLELEKLVESKPR